MSYLSRKIDKYGGISVQGYYYKVSLYIPNSLTSVSLCSDWIGNRRLQLLEEPRYGSAWVGFAETHHAYTGCGRVLLDKRGMSAITQVNEHMKTCQACQEYLTDE